MTLTTEMVRAGQAAAKELRRLGFSVRVRVQENQFVDLWLEVKWDQLHTEGKKNGQ